MYRGVVEGSQAAARSASAWISLPPGAYLVLSQPARHYFSRASFAILYRDPTSSSIPFSHGPELSRPPCSTLPRSRLPAAAATSPLHPRWPQAPMDVPALVSATVAFRGSRVSYIWRAPGGGAPAENTHPGAGDRTSDLRLWPLAVTGASPGRFQAPQKGRREVGWVMRRLQ